MENGGTRFQYIACLNDRDDHISMLSDLIERHCQGWPEFDETRNKSEESEQWALSAKLADKLLNASP